MDGLYPNRARVSLYRLHLDRPPDRRSEEDVSADYLGSHRRRHSALCFIYRRAQDCEEVQLISTTAKAR